MKELASRDSFSVFVICQVSCTSRVIKGDIFLEFNN